MGLHRGRADRELLGELGGRGPVGERREDSRSRPVKVARSVCSLRRARACQRRSTSVGRSATGRTSSPARARRKAVTRCAGSRSVGSTPHAPAASASSTSGERCVSRRSHHTDVGRVAEGRDQGDALLVGPVETHHDDVDGRFGEHPQRTRLVAHRTQHLEPRSPAERQHQALRQSEAVVHDEDPQLVHLTRTSAPPPSELSRRPVPCATLSG